MTQIECVVVYNRDGSIRCVYLDDTRIVGGKPYVSEGLKQEAIKIDFSRIKAVVDNFKEAK